MAKCTLRIELTEAGPFAAGTTLCGTLHVRANEALHVDGSTVKLGYETRGKGTVHRGEPITAAGGAFDLEDGEERAIPFEVPLPLSPVTMEGRLVSVVWTLSAELDVPWAFDPCDALEVEVGPPPPELASAEGSYRDAPTDADGARSTSEQAVPRPEEPKRNVIILGALLASVAVVMWLNAESTNARTSRGFLSPTTRAALTIAAFAYLFWRVAGRRILNGFAARGLGTPAVVASAASPRRGETVDVAVTLDPPGTVEVSRVEAKLVYTESVWWGRRRNRHSDEHVVEADVATFAEGARVSRGEPRTFDAKLLVPEGMCPSFTAPNNTIGWAIVVTVVPVGSLEHVTTIPLKVLA